MRSVHLQLPNAFNANATALVFLKFNPSNDVRNITLTNILIDADADVSSCEFTGWPLICVTQLWLHLSPIAVTGILASRHMLAYYYSELWNVSSAMAAINAR